MGQHLSSALAIALYVSLCASINVLPVGVHTGEPSDAFKELRNVIVHPRGNYQAKLPARLHIPAKPLMPHAPTPDNPAVAVKRTLLGIRQSCPAGYGYCYTSGKCCANGDGRGKCCNDGSCATSSQTCCLYGDRCNNDTKCCQGGCAPTNTDCCGQGHHCNPGEYCCGNNVCAPKGGECCIGGGVCDTGTICMLYNGYKTCCKDTSCSELDTQSRGSSGSGNNEGKEAPPPVETSSISSPDVSMSPGSSGSGSDDGKEAPPPVETSSISIPDVPTSSFNPADYTSLPNAGGAGGATTAITSFTFATITAQSTAGAVLQTFTTTVTIYYYTIFITTTTFIRTESSFITSSFTSTEREVTAVATDSADAEDVFRSLRRDLLDEPTSTISAIGVADFSETRELAGTSTTAGSQFTGAAGAGGDSGLTSAAGNTVMRTWEWGLWVWGIVGIGVGVGMVLL